MHVQAWDSALDAIAALPVDKGNLIVASGVVWDRLPVGMNGAVLKADSSRATGLRWTIGGNVLVWFTSLTSIAVTNTTTESSLIPTSLSGTKTVEPAQMVVGDIVRLEMCGTCTTLAATPGNATFRWKVNGVTLAAAGPHALPTNNALYYFRVSAVFIIRATGAGGSVGGSMEIQLPNGASNTATFRHAHSSGGPVSVDLSGGATIDLTLQMTVADAGNNFTASMVSLKQERAYNLP
jgi:hypothetical protein